MRLSVLLLIAVLSGCAAAGPVFEESAIKKSDGATIVIYRVPELSGAATSWDVKINGTQCDLKYGSFWAFGGVSGPVKITAEHWGAVGTTRLNLNAEKGQTYYVRLQVDDGKTFAAALGGMGGYLAAEGVASNGGPFLLLRKEREDALPEIKSLKQDCI